MTIVYQCCEIQKGQQDHNPRVGESVKTVYQSCRLQLVQSWNHQREFRALFEGIFVISSLEDPCRIDTKWLCRGCFLRCLLASTQRGDNLTVFCTLFYFCTVSLGFKSPYAKHEDLCSDLRNGKHCRIV